MLTVGMYIADRYEVVDKIGMGGMSDVYKAKDHTLGRFVAIKVLKQEFSEDVNFVTKFRTEAQSAAGLEHPNIVNIYDVGNENGMYYIVMEHVEGVTLKTYIEKKGQLSFKETISIAIQVGRGIEAAHNKRIIHRDIKPQNIIISTEGKVKVTDFGIARAASSNTISSDVMGSVHYSSPEQARNGFVDGKSDIYSLGIVMYEMVTGRVPFDGDTTVAVAIQHLQEEMVVPSAFASNLPISVEKIILKCTQKSADRRYQSIEDLLIDLKKALISPNEDFVSLMPLGSVQDKTRVMSPDEVNAIKNEARSVIYEEKREEEPEEEEEEDDNGGFLNPKMEKAVTIMGIVAAIIIVAIIIYIIGSVMGVFRFSGGSDDDKTNTEVTEDDDKDKDKDKTEQVTMISVVGMSETDGKAKLNELGLGFYVKEVETSDEHEQGTIIKQDVAEGTQINKNTTINVTVSGGAETVSVPNVVDLKDSAGIAMLSDVGLLYSRDYRYSSTVAQGKIIEQNPAAGETAKKGDTVTIIVSQGQETQSVPNVIEQPESEARSILGGAGFAVNATSEYSDTVPAEHVIRQDPSPGSQAYSGDSVTIVVSMGKKQEVYSFSYTVDDPGDGFVGAEISLYTEDESQLLNTWSTDSFPYDISHSNIIDHSSGKLKIKWFDEDGGTDEEDVSVEFTRIN